jgi:integrase
VRFHELRHYYASVLIGASASVKVVQTRLGHASAAETLNTYAHIWPDDADVTRAAIQQALAVPARSGVV